MDRRPYTDEAIQYTAPAKIPVHAASTSHQAAGTPGLLNPARTKRTHCVATTIPAASAATAVLPRAGSSCCSILRASKLATSRDRVAGPAMPEVLSQARPATSAATIQCRCWLGSATATSRAGHITRGCAPHQLTPLACSRPAATPRIATSHIQLRRGQQHADLGQATHVS